MKNSQLIDLLRTFSPEETRRMKKWLRSPAHNQRQDCIDLFDYLTENGRLSEALHIEREDLFSVLYPDRPYDDALLRQAMHFLFRAAEEFLLFEDLQQDEISCQTRLSTIFRKRRLEKSFRKTHRKATRLLDQCGLANEDVLRSQYKVLLEHYMQYGQQSRTKTVEHLQEISDGLDQVFIAEKLRQGCMMQSHQIVVKSGYDPGLEAEVLRYVEEKELWKVPAIGMYYFIHRSLHGDQAGAWFERLLRAIDEHGHLFPSEELSDIYKLAINYCIRKLNTGETEFIKLSFDLYQRGLRDGIFLEDGQMSTMTFHNIFRIALLLEKLSWAEAFIDQHASALPPEKRDSIVHFSKARLFFEQGDYDQAMRMLVRTDFEDIHLHLSAKVLLVKMYYELEEYNSLESLLGSLKTYLKRKDILTYHRVTFQNVVKYTQKLLHLSPYDLEKRRKLKTAIEQANPLHEKEWLLKQVDAMHA